MPFHEASKTLTTAWFVAGSAGLLLTAGCPLQDDYTIDSGGSGDAGEAGAGSVTAAGMGGSSSGAGGTGGTGGSGASCSPACTKGECCDGSCVELKADRDNCGTCGNVCSAGRECREGSCTSGWTSMAPPPPGFEPREQAAHVAFGNKLFIFGGLNAFGAPLNTGAIYDARENSWELLRPSPTTPVPRSLGIALWTGDKILLWGGRGSVNTGLASTTGAFFDPETSAWTPLPEGSSGRAGSPAGATATQAVLWGGWSGTLALQDGAERYSINGGSWEPAQTDNNPGRLLHPAWAFTGSALLAYGGRPDGMNATDRAFRYSLTHNTWTELPSGPSARWGSFGAWDGTYFYAWGGRDEGGAEASGSAYNGSWSSMATLGAPSPRWAAQCQSGWAFALDRDDVVVLGGLDTNGVHLHDGGRYDRSLDTWRAVPPWPSFDDHSWGVAALVGSEVVIWGGRTGGTLSSSGHRWAP